MFLLYYQNKLHKNKASKCYFRHLATAQSFPFVAPSAVLILKIPTGTMSISPFSAIDKVSKCEFWTNDQKQIYTPKTWISTYTYTYGAYLIKLFTIVSYDHRTNKKKFRIFFPHYYKNITSVNWRQNDCITPKFSRSKMLRYYTGLGVNKHKVQSKIVKSQKKNLFTTSLVSNLLIS